MELRDLGSEALSVPSDDTEEASLRSVATVAAVPGSPPALSSSEPPGVTPSVGAPGGGRSHRATHSAGPAARGAALDLQSACAAPTREEVSR